MTWEEQWLRADRKLSTPTSRTNELHALSPIDARSHVPYVYTLPNHCSLSKRLDDFTTIFIDENRA